MTFVRRWLLGLLVLGLLLGSLGCWLVAGSAVADEVEYEVEPPAVVEDEGGGSGSESPAGGSGGGLSEGEGVEGGRGAGYEAGHCPGAQLDVPSELSEPQQEIRRLRNDLRAVCEASTQQAGEARLVLSELADELAVLHGDLGPGGSLSEGLADLPAGQCPAPCEVSIDASQLPLAVEGGSGGSVVGDPSAELVEVTESGFLSQRFALWFIAAVLVAALGAYAVVRLVVFRDN